MTNKVGVSYAPQFKRDLKRLFKKYRQVRQDVDRFVQRLLDGEIPGNQVQGTGYTVYKARLRSSDMTRGKSGGYRVIYYLKTTERVVLITIYAKTDQADIRPEDIRRMIEDMSEEN